MKQKYFLVLMLYLLTIIPVSTSIAEDSSARSCTSIVSAILKIDYKSFSTFSTKEMMDHVKLSIKKFYSTSGFKNNDEIIKAAIDSEGRMGSLYKQSYEMLRDEDFRVGIRLPHKTRLKIVANGIINSHQSGDSQGALYARDAVESSYANLTQEEWVQLPDKLKPKYAAVYPSKSSPLLPPESLNDYTGNDLYYLKLDKIRDRATLTPGDSFNRFVYWRGSIDETRQAESWDMLFVSWEDRYLLIPSFAAGLKEDRVGFPKLPKINEFSRADEYGQQAAIIGESSMSPYKMKWDPNMDYVEVQIWDELTLDDIEAFEYKKSPPKGNFLKELEKRGIEIIDGRKK